MSQHIPTMGETTLVNVSRTLACTPEVAFAWWTEPARIAQWWGPTGFSAPAEDMVIEPKIGGRYEIKMVMPDNGGDAWSRGRLIEFEPNRRLVIAWEATPEAGIGETTTHVEFRGEGASTHVELTDGPYATGFAPMAEAGWVQSLDELVTQALA